MNQCPFCNKENPDNIDTCSCGYVFKKEIYEQKQSKATQLPEESIRGRKIVLFIIISTIVLSLFSIIFNTVVIGPNKIPQHIFRFILTLALSYYLFKGVGTARIIAIILYALAAIGGILGGVAFVIKSPIGLTVLIPGIIYLVCVLLLIFSGSIKHFFQIQQKI